MQIAVITGASSGLGGEYVKAVVQRYPQLDEIWLIARRRERLEQWEREFPAVKFRLLALDLSKEESFVQYAAELAAQRAQVRLLINNAGLGTHGDLIDKDVASQTRMVDVNVRALTAVTVATLKHMGKGSRIINVCSIASFAPNPRMTVYCSTKAYVLSFTKSLQEEVRRLGIGVLAVCPGPMATEFLPVAGLEKGTSKTFDTLPYCDPRRVAVVSLKKSDAGKTVYTPRAFYKFYRVLAKLLPHNFIMKLSKT